MLNVTSVFSNGIPCQFPPFAILAVLSPVVTATIPVCVAALGNAPVLDALDLNVILWLPKSTGLLPIPVIRLT